MQSACLYACPGLVAPGRRGMLIPNALAPAGATRITVLGWDVNNHVKGAGLLRRTTCAQRLVHVRASHDSAGNYSGAVLRARYAQTDSCSVTTGSG